MTRHDMTPLAGVQVLKLLVRVLLPESGHERLAHHRHGRHGCGPSVPRKRSHAATRAPPTNSPFDGEHV